MTGPSIPHPALSAASTAGSTSPSINPASSAASSPAPPSTLAPFMSNRTATAADASPRPTAATSASLFSSFAPGPMHARPWSTAAAFSAPAADSIDPGSYEPLVT